MSKFCGNCGAQQPDEANVCGNCGSALASENAGNTDAVSTIKSKAPVIVAAAAVLLVVIILIVALSGGGYKKAVKNMMAVQFEGKANKIEKLAPKEYWDYLEEENEDFDMDEMIEEYEEEWEDRQDYYEDEFGKNYKVKYKIVDKDELSEKKLEDLADALNENFDIKRKDVKKAYKLDIEMTIKGSEDEDDGELEDVLVVKIGSGWYICSEGGYFPYAY